MPGLWVPRLSTFRAKCPIGFRTGRIVGMSSQHSRCRKIREVKVRINRRKKSRDYQKSLQSASAPKTEATGS